MPEFERAADPDLTAPLGAPLGAAGILRGLCRLYAELGHAVLPEVTLATGRRVDLMAIDRSGAILVIEIKSSTADFRADRKWHEYRPFCDRFAFAVGPDFPRALLPDDAGLVIADAYGAEVLRDSAAAPLPAARRKALLLRFALVASARLQRLADPPP